MAVPATTVVASLSTAEGAASSRLKSGIGGLPGTSMMLLLGRCSGGGGESVVDVLADLELRSLDRLDVPPDAMADVAAAADAADGVVGVSVNLSGSLRNDNFIEEKSEKKSTMKCTN